MAVAFVASAAAGARAVAAAQPAAAESCERAENKQEIHCCSIAIPTLRRERANKIVAAPLKHRYTSSSRTAAAPGIWVQLAAKLKQMKTLNPKPLIQQKPSFS